MRYYRIYTGPTQTQTTADRLADAIVSYTLGTEAIYIETAHSPEHILRMLPTWKISDIRELKQVKGESNASLQQS